MSKAKVYASSVGLASRYPRGTTRRDISPQSTRPSIAVIHQVHHLEKQKLTSLKQHYAGSNLFFNRPAKKSQAATEVSFTVAHFLTKDKKSFLDGEIVKGAMTVIANTLFKEHKNGDEITSALSNVQL